MGPGTSSRARTPITILVTLVVVLGEFGFLQAVYHMDDHADLQHAAQARVAGALDAWSPGTSTASVAGATPFAKACSTPTGSLRRSHR